MMLKAGAARLEALVNADRDLLRALVKESLDQVLQAETAESLSAGPSERSTESERLSHALLGCPVGPARLGRAPLGLGSGNWHI